MWLRVAGPVGSTSGELADVIRPVRAAAVVNRLNRNLGAGGDGHVHGIVQPGGEHADSDVGLAAAVTAAVAATRPAGLSALAAGERLQGADSGQRHPEVGDLGHPHPPGRGGDPGVDRDQGTGETEPAGLQ